MEMVPLFSVIITRFVFSVFAKLPVRGFVAFGSAVAEGFPFAARIETAVNRITGTRRLIPGFDSGMTNHRREEEKR